MTSGRMSQAPEVDDVQDLRANVLAQARRMIAASGGPRVVLDGVGLDHVVRAAKVARTSAYRVWPNREAFHRDLTQQLAAACSADVPSLARLNATLMVGSLADNLGQLETVESRRELLRNMLRENLGALFRTVVESSQWRTYLTLSTTAMSQDAGVEDAPLRASLALLEQTLLRQSCELYEDLSLVLGYRLRSGMTYEALCLIGIATMKGLALQCIAEPERVDQQIVLDDGSEASPAWSLMALAADSLLLQWVEFDLDHDVPQGMTSYLKRLAQREASAAAALARGR